MPSLDRRRRKARIFRRIEPGPRLQQRDRGRSSRRPWSDGTADQVCSGSQGQEQVQRAPAMIRAPVSSSSTPPLAPFTSTARDPARVEQTRETLGEVGDSLAVPRFRSQHHRCPWLRLQVWRRRCGGRQGIATPSNGAASAGPGAERVELGRDVARLEPRSRWRPKAGARTRPSSTAKSSDGQERARSSAHLASRLGRGEEQSGPRCCSDPGPRPLRLALYANRNLSFDDALGGHREHPPAWSSASDLGRA